MLTIKSEDAKVLQVERSKFKEIKDVNDHAS
jgi:hypothetical protein